MKKTSKIGYVVAALSLAGLIAAFADINSESIPSVNGQGSNPYIGTFYAYAKMTNGAGMFWIVPPTGTTNGIFKDASGFPSPYTSSVVVMRKLDNHVWYTNNNNSVTFPATNSSYALTVYVNSATPPPTNGQPLTLQVQWQ